MANKTKSTGWIGNGGIKYVSSELTPDRIAYWVKVPEWTSAEVAALLCGVDPDFVRKFPDSLQEEEGEINDLRRLMERATPGDCRSGAPPGKWLALAKGYGLRVPHELENAIAPITLANSKTAAGDAEIDSWIRERDAAEGRRVGKVPLWKLAQEIGLCTKQKLEERARLAARAYPLRVGRLRGK